MLNRKALVFLFLAIVICLSNPSSADPAAAPKSASDWVSQADALYQSGDYAESSQAFAAAFAAGANHPKIYYNAACSASLADEPDQALEWLTECMNHGWRDIHHLRADSDLFALHEDERWSTIVDQCIQNEVDFRDSIELPGLRDELLAMMRIDQAFRRGHETPDFDVDGENTARMKEIVAEFGWPTKTRVGVDGASAAWLLVQHADRDPAFQRTCLELMRAAPEGEVSTVELAYLTDRVRVNEGKEQLYGTQFWTVDGELVPRPIENEEEVEARRAAMGMETMESYRKLMTGG